MRLIAPKWHGPYDIMIWSKRYGPHDMVHMIWSTWYAPDDMVRWLIWYGQLNNRRNFRLQKVLTVRAKYGFRFVFDWRYSIQSLFNPFAFSHFSGFLSKSFYFKYWVLCWPKLGLCIKFILDCQCFKRIILSHKFRICIMQMV